jgi:hypothetical protein
MDKEPIFLFSLLGMCRIKPMDGRIRGESFRMWRKIGYGNAFRPCLIGHFVPSGEDTTITGRFAVHPYFRGLAIVTFSGFALTLILALKSLVMGETHLRESGGGILISLAGCVFTLFLVKLGQWLGRHDPPVILAFLERLLEARREERDGSILND